MPEWFFTVPGGTLLPLAQVAAHDLPSPGPGVIAALIVFIGASVWLGTLAQRVVRRSSFVKGFFLGNRGLGAWALALTATVQSGGTFMGFPSLVYSHGWIVALWIGSYMVVPITGFGMVGKRIAQISRRTGAITMPDLFRERFDSPALGLITSLLVILFLSAAMVAQFKAGATVMKLAFPGTQYLSFSEESAESAIKEDVEAQGFAESRDLATAVRWLRHNVDWPYMLGLLIFSLTVVGYTLIGGFLAAVWTDLFQSVMMFIGVLVLLGLALYAVGGLENASRGAAAGAQLAADEAAAAHDSGDLQTATAGERYLTGPGFSPEGRAFLPLSLAISFFVLWPASGFATPAGVTRIMACKNTRTLRQSIFLLCVYNLGIYIPLICICMCARTLMPNLDKPDEVIPRMALTMTEGLPAGQLISGMILAAPFGAIMASVSTYLVVIAAGLVRDLYQRFLRPEATEQELRRMSRLGMVGVGVFAFALNVYPVKYLQAVIVFASGGVGAAFIVPCLMLCYWRRATAAGVLAAMIVGSAIQIVFYLLGPLMPDLKIGQDTSFRPFFLLGMEPLIWSLCASAIGGIAVSLCTAPPDEELVSRLFDAREGAEA
jgi:sodium/pantothenate symporter